MRHRSHHGFGSALGCAGRDEDDCQDVGVAVRVLAWRAAGCACTPLLRPGRSSRANLQIFAKPPLPGLVKTRLAATLGDAAAAAVYRDLVLRTLGVAAAARRAGIFADVELWVAPDAPPGSLATWGEQLGIALRIQHGANLGDRMRNALQSSLATGTPAVVVGTDVPGFDIAYLARAAAALQSGEAVVGPAEDGGYVLDRPRARYRHFHRCAVEHARGHDPDAGEARRGRSRMGRAANALGPRFARGLRPLAGARRNQRFGWRRDAVLMTIARCAAAAASVIAACTLAAATAQSSADGRITSFSRAVPGAAYPPGWTTLTVKGVAPSRYALVRDGEQVVVRAEATSTASGLAFVFPSPVADARKLRWRWKGEQLPAGGDTARRATDDAVARLYVTFRHPPERLSMGQRAFDEMMRALYGEAPPHATLLYVWDNRAAVGTSGSQRLHRSRPQHRCRKRKRAPVAMARLRAGYRRGLPDRVRRDAASVSGVALMTDADNTGTSASRTEHCARIAVMRGDAFQPRA